MHPLHNLQMPFSCSRIHCFRCYGYVLSINTSNHTYASIQHSDVRRFFTVVEMIIYQEFCYLFLLSIVTIRIGQISISHFNILNTGFNSLVSLLLVYPRVI